MNCLEFRRAALANPHHPGHDALAHEADCPACARFYRELRLQEEQLYEAMCVPVPEGLADRILLRRASSWREWLAPRIAVPALAASLMLAVVLGVVWKQTQGMPAETLAMGIAAHVEHDAHALAASAEVPAATLMTSARRGGLDSLIPPGRPTYVDHCPLPGGGSGEHIVFDTPHGKITLIIMPTKKITMPLRLDRNGLTVSLMPAGEGSIALVTANPQTIEEAEKWARQTLRWANSRT
ncbi:MAG: hypothetical protein B7Y26_13240 [Hydrogenophilales bacterium 16-64-46]|nr:MAG: hypothetical protein B7Z32_12790 [Hydrogenophilales bacterium 12-64-13]OYZ04092.1 MAG: hypothetical protein B7Y26_13240 [Hydrogenophilales bacterium 16-64-46]OZA36841.1 MAG: hypothetical protein B7X87_12795 [Hydrogenophilales bacterium 17-64-34]HQT00047.1 DUF3379 family protein [Thiobacillus sp.]